MKYIIFCLELIAIFLWLKFGTTSILTGVIGVAIIIIISQGLHSLLKAR